LRAGRAPRTLAAMHGKLIPAAPRAHHAISRACLIAIAT
jgi:hypothetical protein